MTISVPGDAMVVLIGISGSGKTTFAARHFAPTQVLSSDAFRAMVSDDEADQSATDDAFELLHAALRLRLRRGRLTVVDATNVKLWARRDLLDVAARFSRPAVAIVLDLPAEECVARMAQRGIRNVPKRAMQVQQRDLRRSLSGLTAEGFAAVHVLTAGTVDGAQVRVSPQSSVVEQRATPTQRNVPEELRPIQDARSLDRHRNA